jgi:ubiquinone/menaquinone biosynthesis C-methylase UbiE
MTVLDLSLAALDVARKRLGDDAERVHWIEGDITTVALPDVWHDCAVSFPR